MDPTGTTSKKETSRQMARYVMCLVRVERVLARGGNGKSREDAWF
jgi:hypothetical protein